MAATFVSLLNAVSIRVTRSRLEGGPDAQPTSTLSLMIHLDDDSYCELTIHSLNPLPRIDDEAAPPAITTTAFAAPEQPLAPHPQGMHERY